MRRMLLCLAVMPWIPATWAGVEPLDADRLLVYRTVDGNALHLHLFEPTGAPGGGARPGIVFFFGGGWVGGSPSQFYPHCRHLAERGMVALAAEYRVRSRNGTGPEACVADGKAALRWVRAHARELGVDPTHIAAGGGSAGGHVAAAVALCPGFEEGQDLAVSCRPNALVLFNPVFDNGPGGWGHERVAAFWRRISPLHNLHAGAPPTIVFLGTADKLIPVDTADRYQRRMQALGSRCELHLYLGEGHGFFNYRGDTNPNYERTVAAMDAFLEGLGYLTARP